jgi:magnesium transporter
MGETFEAKGFHLLWLPSVTESDLAALQKQFRFHHLDYEDIRTKSPISKMDAYKHYVFFVFHIPTIHQDTGYVFGNEMYAFLSKDSLVIATHRPIPAVTDFMERMGKSSKFRSMVLGKAPAFCLQKLLGEVFRDSLEIISNLTVEVRRLEEAIEIRHDKHLTVDLGHARRNILFLRHIIDPQRTILSSLAHFKRDFISEDLIVYFDDVHDVLDTIWLSADNLKLIIDGLFDVNEALLSHRTNQVLTFLTFISAVLMVPTLIAGFYGMNVSWLPLVEDVRFITALYAIGFFGMVAIVGAIIRRSRR